MLAIILGYLDPGAGSLLFQAALAAALTVPLLFRSKISALLALLREGRSRRHVDERPADSARPR